MNSRKNKGIAGLVNKALPGGLAAVATLAGLCFALLALSACNTVEGAGKDIERGGENLQKAAN